MLAATAYESGLDWYTHDCTGEVEVAGQTYRCALGRAHGVVNLRGALEQSCNTYFIELGRLLGAQRIRKMAETLGFGTATQLAPGLQGASGTLPDAAALENPGELATFSFGQGALTVTPLQITAMMNTVANGGVYRTPAFVQGIVDADGTLTGQTRAADTRTVFDAATARVLRSMLASVVSEGSAARHSPKPARQAARPAQRRPASTTRTARSCSTTGSAAFTRRTTRGIPLPFCRTAF